MEPHYCVACRRALVIMLYPPQVRPNIPFGRIIVRCHFCDIETVMDVPVSDWANVIAYDLDCQIQYAREGMRAYSAMWS